jgi:hypothetical protein
MTDDRYLDTINRAIDGEASAAELALLDTAMQQSPEVRESWESMRELANALDSEPLVNPPPALRENVLQQLRKRRGKPPLHVASATAHHRRRRFAIAWAAAAAIVIATSVFVSTTLTDRNSRLRDRAAGTLTPVDSASWPVLTHASSADGSTSVEIRSSGDVVAVTPSSSVARPITLEWNPASLRFVSISGGHARRTGAAVVSFTSAEGRPVIVLERVGAAPSYIVLRSGNDVLLKVAL